MKSLMFLIALTTQISLSFAGNGVERGLVLNRSGFALGKEIKSYLNKNLDRCLLNSKKEVFQIQKVVLEKDEVDQGIVDLYYKMDLIHKNDNGKTINELSIEVEDADYSNWRRYEEKLSLQVLKDRNQICL